MARRASIATFTLCLVSLACGRVDDERSRTTANTASTSAPATSVTSLVANEPGEVARDPGAIRPASLTPEVPKQAPDTTAKQDEHPRVFAKSRHVWVRSEPTTGSAWIGYLGLGDAVRTRGETLRGDGKCKGFIPIEPRGFVCLDEHVSTDANDPQVKAIQRFAPKLDQAWPHHYGEAIETPRYRTMPTEAQQRSREWGQEARKRAIAAVRAGQTLDPTQTSLLAGIDTGLSGQTAPPELALLPAVHEFRDKLRAGSFVSWSDTFDDGDRGWLVTGDMVLVPRDRVKPLPKSEFQGLRDAALVFPIAYPRRKDRVRHERDAEGNVVATSKLWPRLGAIAVTSERVESRGHRYLVARDGGLIDEREATLIEPAPRTPWGEAVDTIAGAVDTKRAPFPSAPKPTTGRGTWIEVSVHGGWMIAYEGTRPVYATLVAPGRGETIGKGEDAFVMSATPDGTFALRGKFWTETLAVTSVVHADVPFVMPYEGSHAFHAAYWHDRWGEKVSMGCVNLAPIDARWVFTWAEPEIPEGWHGVTTAGQKGSAPATIVVIHG